MAHSSPFLAFSTSTTVFNVGNFTTQLLTINGGGTCSRNSSSILSPLPPKPLIIGTPSEPGIYPVLLLIHGYLLYNSFYSGLIQHISSHGFIVVAPQLYTLAGPDATEEIKSTAAITNWFSEGLQNFLPSNVQLDLNKLALAGHSRGGKVVFALALEKTTTLKFSALIGIDPVDGMDKGKQTPPPVLTYVPHSFDLDMAVMVIGSGLGEVKKNPLFPACAPKGVNHEDFYNECREPSCYFVAKDYGHQDLLDDNTPGIRGKFTYCLCKNGKSRDPMRRFTGGIIVAFLKAYLEDDFRDLDGIKNGHIVPPLEIQNIDFLV
ncbi:hypothetical protein M9H77_00604 [Catharanthus roseus]|nr:hypothetical protein M9H77_00604 [Catharanthus roseus]